MLQSLELNRAYYHQCIAPILAAHCPEIAGRHAAALVGWGSEVLGNDDAHSRAYGWGPRVVLFLRQPDYLAQRDAVRDVLQKHVPLTFGSYPTRFTDPTQGPPQPIESQNGVLQIPITTCERFVERYLGVPDLNLDALALDPSAWLLISEAGLLRLTAGELYYDGVGDLTKLRAFFAYYPDDVWRYRLAYQWTRLSWDIDLVGLCAHRGDTLSARLAAARSVARIVELTFLLNRVYKPGYLKWLHRQFYKLPMLAFEIGPLLQEALVVSDAMHAVQIFYRVLDRLISAQCALLGLLVPDYQHSAELDRGFFGYNLEPVIASIKRSIRGELCELPFQVGAVDQWLLDQDLLMSPTQWRSLKMIYDLDNPIKVLFDRNEFEHFM